ncbi:MAG: pyridoxamine 5'-phosphate oxidase family protein [Fimbriimonadaceae bacterium]|nr:pyridoxamine 5'-phosphate oxidase family protein [Fimbriimonadaceae bacterium]QYK55725.1 MAG: pyridoxamine 5'-phosphate oxidase family protein [Fimbriimonadaceae bacterium]
MERHEHIQKLRDLVEGVKVAMLVTESGGQLRSRPMFTNEIDADGVLWFFSACPSGKTHEIGQDSHVNLSYSDPKHDRYVSISGRASVVEDRIRIRDMWNPMVSVWFPEGPDDPSVCLIKVPIESAEYWEAKKGHVAQMIDMALAGILGRRPDLGETHKIEL